MMADTEQSYLANLALFAAGRCTARQEMRGPTFQEAIAIGPRWYPRVAGKNVAPTNPTGFERKEDAIEDARLFRDHCRRHLAAKQAA